MATLTEGDRAAEFLQSPANGYRSFETVTVDAAGTALEAGAVLGQITTAGASAVADGGNTGDGALTVDVTDPVLADAQVGAYIVTITEAATNGGQYTVTDPDGDVVGVANVGDTFANEIKFVLADGATDFALGDFWTVTVAAGSGKYVAYDAAATDGSATVAGILYAGVESTHDGDAVIIKRDAEVKHYKLNYTGTKATVVAGLADLGIISRD